MAAKSILSVLHAHHWCAGLWQEYLLNLVFKVRNMGDWHTERPLSQSTLKMVNHQQTTKNWSVCGHKSTLNRCAGCICSRNKFWSWFTPMISQLNVWEQLPQQACSRANELMWCWRFDNMEKKAIVVTESTPGVPKGTIQQWVVLPLQLLQGLSVCKHAPLAVYILLLLRVQFPDASARSVATVLPKPQLYQ